MGIVDSKGRRFSSCSALQLDTSLRLTGSPPSMSFINDGARRCLDTCPAPWGAKWSCWLLTAKAVSYLAGGRRRGRVCGVCRRTLFFALVRCPLSPYFLHLSPTHICLFCFFTAKCTPSRDRLVLRKPGQPSPLRARATRKARPAPQRPNHCRASLACRHCPSMSFWLSVSKDWHSHRF